jgi:NDP-sugar pyrophosphorylase family protein
MSSQFEVVTGISGTIDYFIPKRFPDTHVYPRELAEYMNGVERIMLNGVEHVLYEDGSVIYPDVDFIDYALLNGAVILGKGTTFTHLPSGKNDFVKIGSEAKVDGAVIGARVKIGARAVVLAQYVGNDSTIGEDTEVSSGVIIGKSVRIDGKSTIGKSVIIGDSAKLGKAIVGENAIIGTGAEVGRFKGSGAEAAKKGITIIAPGKNIPAGMRLD